LKRDLIAQQMRGEIEEMYAGKGRHQSATIGRQTLAAS